MAAALGAGSGATFALVALGTLVFTVMAVAGASESSAGAHGPRRAR